MGLKELASVVGLVLFVLFIGKMLGVFGAKKPSGGVPLPDGGVVAPALKRPAPKWYGFLWIKDAFDEGERIILALWVNKPTDLGTAGPCAVQRGLVDNGTGPYKVRVEALRGSDGARVPVYAGDTGPRCDGEWIDPGEIVVYANGVRPYGAIGSLTGCNKFVPLDDADGKPRDCGKITGGTGVVAVVGKVTYMTMHVQIRNADGELSPVYEQSTVVVPSNCKKTK
jgi:hypothetical protein